MILPVLLHPGIHLIHKQEKKYSDGMDQFQFLNLSPDALNESLGPRPIINDAHALGSIPLPSTQAGLSPGLTPAAAMLDGDIDQYLSGDSISFLHQKLAETTGLNASYAQRESRLQETLEALKAEKQGVAQRCDALLNDQKKMKNEQTLLQQKADQETRLRFTYQDKLSCAAKSLEEQIKRAEESEQTVERMKSELAELDNFSGDVYEIANMSATQVDNLKEEVAVLEKMRDVYKASYLKADKENVRLCSEMETVKEKLNSLEETFKGASSEIDELKKENAKQEQFIGETLNRFKEISGHFSNMKEQFLLQQQSLGEYQNDTKEKSELICAMRDELHNKEKEVDEIRCLSATREEELARNVEKLEDTLNGLIGLREELENKNKQRGEIIENLREENIRCKAELESARATLNVERDYSTEKVAGLTNEREEGKKTRKELVAKLKSYKDREKQLYDAKDHFEKQANEMTEENKTMREILNELKTRSTAEKSNLEGELSAKEKELSKLRISVSNNGESLKRTREELSTVKKELSLLRIDKDKVDAERKELSDRLDDSTTTNQEDQKRIKEFEERMIKCQFLFMENDKKFTELSERCGQLESEKIEDKYRISNLNEELERIKHQCVEEMKTNDLLKLEVEESKSKLECSDRQAKTNAESMKAMAAGVREEIESCKQECAKKDEEINALYTQANEYKKLCDDGNKELAKSCEQYKAAMSKNESLSDTVSKVSSEKQDYLVIIENFTKRESDLKSELDKRLNHQKELEHTLREQKREFEQYKVNVENYDRLWQTERDQGLKELQDELSREQRIFDHNLKKEYFSPSPRKPQRRSVKSSPALSPR